MSGTKLYFVALLPTTEVYQAVDAFKREAFELFHSKKALNSPPHITLVPPFRITDEHCDELLTLLEQIAESINPFIIELKGVSGFPRRVIYVDVLQSIELTQLQLKLKDELSNLQLKGIYWHPNFTPHMTIAFKDLKEEDFEKALAHFDAKKFGAVYVQTTVCILIHQDGKWEVFKQFAIGSK